MRTFLFLLLFPIASFAGDYNYSKVISLNRGSDNFSFDKVQTKDAAGEINFSDNILIIDGKKYELKASDAANVFKSRSCSFELVYKGEELAAVKMYKSNKVDCYVIKQEQALITKK